MMHLCKTITGTIIIRNHLNIPKFVIVTKSWNLTWVVSCTSAFTRIPQCFKGKVNDTVIMYLIRYCSSFLPILKNRDQDVPIADYPTTPLDPVRSTDIFYDFVKQLRFELEMQ